MWSSSLLLSRGLLVTCLLVATVQNRCMPHANLLQVGRAYAGAWPPGPSLIGMKTGSPEVSSHLCMPWALSGPSSPPCSVPTHGHGAARDNPPSLFANANNVRHNDGVSLAVQWQRVSATGGRLYSYSNNLPGIPQFFQARPQSPTAGLDPQYTHTKNQFTNEPKGLRQI